MCHLHAPPHPKVSTRMFALVMRASARWVGVCSLLSQEVAQWAFRERQADEANEARIQALQAALEARDKEAEFLIEQVRN